MFPFWIKGKKYTGVIIGKTLSLFSPVFFFEKKHPQCLYTQFSP